MRPNVRTASAGALVSLLVFGAACSRRVPESRITSVEARIDGITCPTCVPPLEASLRRQYHKSAIEVDDDKLRLGDRVLLVNDDGTPVTVPNQL